MEAKQFKKMKINNGRSTLKYKIQIPMDEDSETRVVDGEIKDAEGWNSAFFHLFQTYANFLK